MNETNLTGVGEIRSHPYSRSGEDAGVCVQPPVKTDLPVPITATAREPQGSVGNSAGAERNSGGLPLSMSTVLRLLGQQKNLSAGKAKSGAELDACDRLPRVSSVHAVDHDSTTPVNPEGLADWIDDQRNRDVAAYEAELEAEYQNRILQEETNP